MKFPMIYESVRFANDGDRRYVHGPSASDGRATRMIPVIVTCAAGHDARITAVDIAKYPHINERWVRVDTLHTRRFRGCDAAPTSERNRFVGATDPWRSWQFRYSEHFPDPHAVCGEDRPREKCPRHRKSYAPVCNAPAPKRRESRAATHVQLTETP